MCVESLRGCRLVMGGIFHLTFSVGPPRASGPIFYYNTDPTVCQVVLPAGRSGVSRNHCKITFDSSSRMFIIHDLGSTNGTFLENGQRVPQGVPYAVHPGTKIYLANPSIFFELRY